MTTRHPTVTDRPVEPNRRCRAAVPDFTGYRYFQCSNRAKVIREIGVPAHELPVCGVHARSGTAREYQPHDRFDSAIEAVVR